MSIKFYIISKSILRLIVINQYIKIFINCIQEKEKTDEVNTGHDVSQDAFPASDSPADKNGVSEQAKHPESIS